MLSFIKKLFGSKPAEVTAPYKVEAPAAEAPAKKPAAKKTAVKAKTTRKPRTPKA
jgi:hypothetical protein